MRLSAGILFIFFQGVVPLLSQEAVVEVVDYIPYEEGATPPWNMLEGSPLNGMCHGGGIGVGVVPSTDTITVQQIMSERRGGNYCLPATTGCGPIVLRWDRQVSKSTLISGNAGLSYVAAVQATYGVTDTVSVTTGGSYELVKGMCGYIVGKEGLRYAEFDILKNNKRIGSGAIIYLQDVQVIKNIGNFQP